MRYKELLRDLIVTPRGRVSFSLKQKRSRNYFYSFYPFEPKFAGW